MKNQESDITFLLNQCKENNQKAQLAIYNSYYKAMFNVAFRIVNDYALAEDIMQESFLKAFAKLDSYSGKVTFGAWLKKIVVNKSIDEFKKSNKYQIETLNDKNQFVDENDTEDQTINTQIKAENLLQKMKLLKPNYNLILTLHFIEGYDLEELTQILNISYENCRTMMSRAKKSLRKKINE